MITTFKYNLNNKNDYDLAKHDVFKLIDKTLFYKEKTKITYGHTTTAILYGLKQTRSVMSSIMMSGQR